MLWPHGLNISELDDPSSLSAAPFPQMAPNWTIFSSSFSDPTLSVQVTQDPLVLEAAVEMVVSQNEEMSSFQPSLAVVITWHNNVSAEDGPTVR